MPGICVALLDSQSKTDVGPAHFHLGHQILVIFNNLLITANHNLVDSRQMREREICRIVLLVRTQKELYFLLFRRSQHPGAMATVREEL